MDLKEERDEMILSEESTEQDDVMESPVSSEETVTEETSSEPETSDVPEEAEEPEETKEEAEASVPVSLGEVEEWETKAEIDPSVAFVEGEKGQDAGSTGELDAIAAMEIARLASAIFDDVYA